jgi:hypothetical protein
MRKLSVILVFAGFTFFTSAWAQECTIGAAAGRATADGRPLLWKTRDYITEPDNKVRFVTNQGYRYLAVTNGGEATIPRMGVNEYGFAIIVSTSEDLSGGSLTGPGSGTLSKMALTTCKTVDEFQALLDQTNITGRTTRNNFGVIDTTGAAAIFETANYAYWRYNANDELNGYVLRTNFAFNGGGSGGIERYYRTVQLIGDFYSGDSLSHKSILRYQMRDFSDAYSQPVSIPYNGYWDGKPFGYIDNTKSICRNTTVSASVIQGTLPGERAAYTTMWTLLGQPATSIFIPYWPVAATPAESTGTLAELGDIANQIRALLYDLPSYDTYLDTYKLLDGSGKGLWTKTFPFEDNILTVVDAALNNWRQMPAIPVADIKYTEDTIAYKTYQYLLGCYGYLLSGMTPVESPESIAGDPLLRAEIYPNPFETEAVLRYEVPVQSTVTIEIFTLTGTRIGGVVYSDMAPGEYTYTIGGSGLRINSGLLIVKLNINGRSRHFKLIRR